MRILPVSYKPQNRNIVSFGNQYQKLINGILNCKNPRRLNVTFEDAKKIYEKLGYPIQYKSGSHAIVTMKDGFEFAIVIPHGNNKNISARDVKRLQYALNNNTEAMKKF